MTSIRDVALLAGVSVGTFSHAVNGTARVSPEKTASVRDAIRELNYQPHAVARQLATRRTRAIGVICKIANLTGPEIVAGIQAVAWRHDYTVLLYDAHQEPQKNAEYFHLLAAGQVDGMIVLTARVQMHDIMRARGVGKPLILWNHQHTSPPDVPTVNADWSAGTYMAVKHLFQADHRRVGLICGPRARWTVQQRIRGYRDALADAGVGYSDDLVVGDDFEFAGGAAGMAGLLRLADPPSAVIAMHDIMAVGAANTILDARLRIPDDVAVIGFDDTLIAATFRPSLTSVRVPKRELGVAAATMLLQLIGGAKDVPSDTIVPLDLVVRESTGGPRKVEDLASLGD